MKSFNGNTNQLPSVTTTAICAAFSLIPFCLWNDVVLAYPKAAAVFVPPPVYLKQKIANKADELISYMFFKE